MKSILSPRQFAQGIGVSESSVKRWIDDGQISASRTAGGHRRIPIQEAARYIRDHGVVVVRPDVIGLAEVGGARREPTEAAGERLLGYLRSGSASEARGLLLSRYLEGSSVAEIVDGPLEYAMARIGEAWVENDSGIFWEHRATQIAIEALARLRLALPSGSGGVAAVGGAPSGDPYLLPSVAVAAVMEAEGLQATNLGPETPLSSLALAAADLDARIVWLSVSVVADCAKLRRGIEKLASESADRGAVLAVGGSQAAGLRLTKVPGLFVGRSMAELEALVQGMRFASTTRA